MGMLIKEILDIETLYTLISNFNPSMIRQENIAQAAKGIVKTVSTLELYPSFQSLINQFEQLQEKYPSIYDHRPFYIWQVCETAFQLATLNLTDTDFIKSNLMKCQLGFITVLFDDICDMGHDKALFDKCVLALKGQIGQDEVELYEIFAETWSAFQSAFQKTPNYELLKPDVEQATQKWIDSFEYGLWLEGTSRSEEKWERHLDIIAHSGTIYLGGLIDLSFLPNISAHQIAAASELFLCTQKMIQIINWLGSWEREFTQRDFTSGVFSMAIQYGWVNWDELNNESLEKIRQKIRSSPVESQLWNEWERLREESHQLLEQVQLPALNKYVDHFSIIMFIQLSSSGII